MKVQLFLTQAWAADFLHLDNWAFPTPALFYFSLLDRAVVFLTWMSITWQIQTHWGGSTSVGGCVCERVSCFIVEDLDASKLTQEVKGYFSSLVSTRNVDVIFSVPWNIPISIRLQGGISIAPGFNRDTLCLLLVIPLLIFFSSHQFLTDFWYGKPCMCSCEFKRAEIQM